MDTELENMPLLENPSTWIQSQKTSLYSVLGYRAIENIPLYLIHTAKK
jgi:hypothetical protein